MAATYWQGTTGAFGTAGNWTNGVPSTTKTPAVFDGRSQQSVTSGLDQTGAIFDLKTTRKWRGDIGALGNPLKWSNAGNWHVLRGTGKTHVEPAIAAAELFVVDGGDVFFTTCLLNELVAKSGKCTLASTVDFTPSSLPSSIYILGSGAVVTIEELATTETMVTRFQMKAGQCFNKRLWDGADSTCVITGGFLTQTGVAGDNLEVKLHGGTFKYKPLASTTGHTPSFDVMGGLLDFSEADQVISFGFIRVGIDGAIKASALQNEQAIVDVDFREDFPNF